MIIYRTYGACVSSVANILVQKREFDDWFWLPPYLIGWTANCIDLLILLTNTVYKPGHILVCVTEQSQSYLQSLLNHNWLGALRITHSIGDKRRQLTIFITCLVVGCPWLDSTPMVWVVPNLIWIHFIVCFLLQICLFSSVNWLLLLIRSFSSRLLQI